MAEAIVEIPEEQVELIPVERTQSNIAALSAPGAQNAYFSMPAPDKADPKYDEKMLDYAAIVMDMQGRASRRASEVVNERINLAHVFAHRVQVRDTDTETGEVRYLPMDRLVLLDDEGNTYQAVSQGLIQSMIVLFSLLGQPSTWKRPIPVTIRSVPVRGEWSTLKLAIWREKGKK